MLSTLRIAWRNLGRNRKRTLLAVFAIALAQWALLSMDGMTHGYVDIMLDAITGPMVGHIQVHEPTWREERGLDLVVPDLEAKLELLRAHPEVTEASARVYSPSLVALDVDAVGAMVVGVDTAIESSPTGLLRGVAPESLPRDHNVVVGKILAEKLGITPGSEIAIIGQGVDGSIANDLYIVAAIVSTPVDLVNRLGIVMSLSDAQEFLYMGDEAHEIIIRTTDYTRAGVVAASLAATPELSGLEVMGWEEIVPQLKTIIEMSSASSYIILFLVFIAAAAGIANTMMMATFERTHELGMLRALGATPGRIIQMLITESVVLGIVGVLLGSLIGFGFVYAFQETGWDLSAMAGGDGEVIEMAYEGMTFSFLVFPRLELIDIMRGVIAVFTTSIVASIWPAVHAARIQPVEAMRA